MIINVKSSIVFVCCLCRILMWANVTKNEWSWPMSRTVSTTVNTLALQSIWRTLLILSEYIHIFWNRFIKRKKKTCIKVLFMLELWSFYIWIRIFSFVYILWKVNSRRFKTVLTVYLMVLIWKADRNESNFIVLCVCIISCVYGALYHFGNVLQHKSILQRLVYGLKYIHLMPEFLS